MSIIIYEIKLTILLVDIHCVMSLLPMTHTQRYVHSTGETNEDGREVTMAMLQETKPATEEEWEAACKQDMFPGLSEEEIEQVVLWQRTLDEVKWEFDDVLNNFKKMNEMESLERTWKNITVIAKERFYERGGSFAFCGKLDLDLQEAEIY